MRDPREDARLHMLDLAKRIGRSRTPEGLQFAAESAVWEAEEELRRSSDAMRSFREVVESAICDDWAEAFAWIEASASYLEAVCGYLAETGVAPDVMRRAQYEVCRRGADVAHEVLALLRAGFPDGAHARWRTIYELAVVSHVLASGNRGTASRYLAHRVLVADEARVRLEDPVAIAAEAKRVRRRYNVPFKGIYGWACELTKRKLKVTYPKLHHLEQLAGENTVRLRELQELANHHIHAGSLGNVLARAGAEPTVIDPWRAAPVAAATADATAEIGVAATLALLRHCHRPPQALEGLHHLGLEISTMGASILGRRWDLPRLSELASKFD